MKTCKVDMLHRFEILRPIKQKFGWDIEHFAVGSKTSVLKNTSSAGGELRDQ